MIDKKTSPLFLVKFDLTVKTLVTYNLLRRKSFDIPRERSYRSTLHSKFFDNSWRVKRIVIDFSREFDSETRLFPKSESDSFGFSRFARHFQSIELQGKRKPNAHDFVLVLYPLNESGDYEEFSKKKKKQNLFGTGGRSIRKFRTFGANSGRICCSCETALRETKTKVGT